MSLVLAPWTGIADQIQYLGQLHCVVGTNQVATQYRYVSMAAGDSGRYQYDSLGSQAQSRDIYVPISVSVSEHKLGQNSMSFPRRRESSQNLDSRLRGNDNVVRRNDSVSGRSGRVDCPLGKLCARLFGNGDLTIYGYRYNAKTNPYQGLQQQITYQPIRPSSEIYQKISQTHYQYNLSGQLISSTTWDKGSSAIQTHHQYDALGRLVSSTQSDWANTYRYDANGNMLSRLGHQALAENYNGLDQAQQINGQSMSYDNNGNQQYSMVGNAYQFNARNQLVGVQIISSPSRDQYGYYPDGLRASKQKKNITLHFYYEGLQLLDTVTMSGQQTADYLLADGRLYRGVQQSGQLLNGHYELLTHQGDISGHLMQKGQLTAAQQYGAYGSILSDDSPGSIATEVQSDPFGYDGEYDDSESSLIYLRARYYSPSSLHFISQDSYPLLNRYAFAQGDPLNRIDPMGHFSLPGGAIIPDILTGVGLGLSLAAPFFGQYAGIAFVFSGIVNIGGSASKFTQGNANVRLGYGLGFSAMLLTAGAFSLPQSFYKPVGILMATFLDNELQATAIPMISKGAHISSSDIGPLLTAGLPFAAIMSGGGFLLDYFDILYDERVEGFIEENDSDVSSTATNVEREELPARGIAFRKAMGIGFAYGASAEFIRNLTYYPLRAKLSTDYDFSGYNWQTVMLNTTFAGLSEGVFSGGGAAGNYLSIDNPIWRRSMRRFGMRSIHAWAGQFSLPQLESMV